MAVIDREPIIDRRAHLPNRKSKKFVSLFLVVVIAMSLMTMTALLQPQESDDPPSEPPTRARIAYTTHATILIDGDVGFLGDNSSTGISWGSGTESDPYIIENLDIDASSPDGIHIRNSDVHFIVRGCHICNGFPMYAGVRLYNCTNGTLIDNICSGNDDGIYLHSSNDNEVIGNNCSSGNYRGIYLYLSDDNYVSDNDCSSNQFNGISLEFSDDNTVCNNECNSNIGRNVYIYFSDNNTVNNNDCSMNSARCIYLYSSVNNTISDNNCSSNNAYGIIIEYSARITIINNDCRSGDWGLALYSSISCVITGNDFSDAYYGIALYSSSGNIITWNEISGNQEYGIILLSDGHDNSIWNNTFTDNNGASSTYDSNHVQACDDGSNNWWNSTEGYGNYWSDWTTPDADFNGIVDEPYDIDGSAGAKDYYPRTTPAVIPEFSSPAIIVVIAAVMVAVFAISRRSREKRP
jgi:parallel beta-helix repeat protein